MQATAGIDLAKQSVENEFACVNACIDNPSCIGVKLDVVEQAYNKQYIDCTLKKSGFKTINTNNLTKLTSVSISIDGMQYKRLNEILLFN